MNFPIGGRYCSMITVEIGKACVFERMRARTAAAAGGTQTQNATRTDWASSISNLPSTPEFPRVRLSAASQTLYNKQIEQ